MEAFQRFIDLVFLEEKTAVSGIFAQNIVAHLQNFYGTEGDVFEVPEGSCD